MNGATMGDPAAVSAHEGTAPGVSWRRRRTAIIAFARTVAGPLVGAGAVAALAAGEGTPFESGAIAFLAFALAGLRLLPFGGHLGLLPLARTAATTARYALAFGLLVLAQSITGLPDASLVELFAATLASALPGALARRLLPAPAPIRTAVIGSATSAQMLARELTFARERRYELVGHITTPGDAMLHDDLLAALGTLDDLGTIVERNGIELLLMTGDVSRMAVFEELARSCLHLPVRLWELAGFYEDAFGHVPMAEINASWFQYIMHPRFRAQAPAGKRALDVLVSVPLLIAVAPMLLVLALLVRQDGGPAIFRQSRIGEGGRPFTVYKLRTMRVADQSGAWAMARDPRVTPLGAVLRRTHLDELPQLLNVLRGDMSLVGPRPEQPGFVERLEQTIPFYSRRHLVKPGMTGWAQVRCGYAGSDVGSAWKLCHDMYYLKHRSLLLDVAIITETMRMLVADRQYDVAPAEVRYILRPALLAEGDQHPSPVQL